MRSGARIELLGDYLGNKIYIKREDLLSYCFGGNKARKAELFFRDIDKGNYDCIVTYGSSNSNHCRVISNLTCQRRMPCYIICPEEASEQTFNRKMVELFGAEYTVVSTRRVHIAIRNKMEDLRKKGYNPYFIPGGGHGNIGTQAYVNCYKEIKQYEQDTNQEFDYLFFASGTGTTQAGLLCGKLLSPDDRKKIIGISIARTNPRGANIVIGSIKEYLIANGVTCFTTKEIEQEVFFVDDFIKGGYAKSDEQINEIIKQVMINYGIPLDSVYTGKAFWGMQEYIRLKKLENQKILFIHTGGTPLFFDELLKMVE